METYISHKQKIISNIDRIPMFSSQTWFRRFAFFSASLGHYMPDIPYQQHLSLFRKTLLNQQLSFLDEEYHTTLTVQGEAIPTQLGLSGRPAILATFHSGSYRLINYLLARQEIPFALLMSGDVLEQQGDAIRHTYAQIQEQSGTPITLINASVPSSGIQILRALNEGKSLLAYPDGNTGSPGRTDGQLAGIPFMSGSMYVRKGLAWLAQKAGVPLHVVISTRNNDNSIKLQCTRSFMPGPAMETPGFVEVATQHMYDDLAVTIAAEPWQWENWLHIHHYIPA